MNEQTRERIARAIAAAMETPIPSAATPEEETAGRAWFIRTFMKAFTVPQMVDFMAAEGVRWATARPRRADVVEAFVEAFVVDAA